MPLEDTLKPVLKSQYHAALAMLRDAVERCPDELWTASGHVSAFWQVAYHTLFFTHLYLHADEAAFRPWDGTSVTSSTGRAHQAGRSEEPPAAPAGGLLEEPTSWLTGRSAIGWSIEAVDGMDLDAPSCGFWWYRVSKLEHQLINLRHLQHHTAQLADRLRTAVDVQREVGRRAASASGR